MALPRTNSDAATWWASFLTGTEPCPARDVNSIVCTPDAIYSFGRHYPMARVFRREDGTVRRVVITASYYPNKGFARTPQDQSSVKYAILALGLDKLGVRVDELPLSHHGAEDIPCLPNPYDPEIKRAYCSVPPYFWAANPGPEPVKPADGCIAGTHETFEAQTETLLWTEDAREASLLFTRPTSFSAGRVYEMGARLASIYYGTESYSYLDKGETKGLPNVTYKQCPHCRAHDAVHRRWYQAMHYGPSYRHGRFGGYGYLNYSKQMNLYGSEAAWRHERLMDLRATRANNSLADEWSARNHLSYGDLSTDADGVVILVDGTYAMRKDQVARDKRQRRVNRARAREARERVLHDAERRRVNAFKERMRKRREENGGFVVHAHLAAERLHNLRTGV